MLFDIETSRAEEVGHASFTIIIVYGANQHNTVKYARKRTFAAFHSQADDFHDTKAA